MIARPATRIGLVALLVLLGCSESEDKVELPESKKPASEQQAAVGVEMQTVRRQALAVPVRATGSTAANREAKLATEATARVQSVRVQEGEQVKKGQVLARLDMREEALQAAQARASAAQAQVQASQAETEHERLRPLADRGAIAPTRADDAQARMKAAEQAARAAQAAADAAERRLRHATVRAPFAATVVEVPVEAGEVATGGATVLVRLLDLSALEIRVRVHERDLARLAKGDRADVHVPSASTDVEGEVARIGWELDERTRTGEVVVRVPNEDRSLRAGMFAEATIHPSGSREGLLVPHSAVGGSDESRFVYVVEDGTAHRREVQVTRVDEDRWEITDGLEPSESVVTTGLDRLADGSRVTPADEAGAEESEPTAAATRPDDEGRASR